MILILNQNTIAQALTPIDSLFQYPKPNGEYHVGTRFMVLTDSSRPDIFTEDTSDFRQISIRIWYPAQPKPDSEPIHYYRKKVAAYFMDMGLFKSSFMEDIAMHSSYSFLDAPIVNKRKPFPIVIFSSSGIMNANIFLFENLASHGYVVISVGHPHWCIFYYKKNGETFFPDYDNDIYYQNMWKEERSEAVTQTKEKITLAKNVNEKKELLKQLNKLMPLEISDVRLWVQDFDFILKELTKLNKRGDFFKGMVDFDKVGIFGYSKGGVAAAHACLSNKKFKAGINLSGFMFGDILNKDIKVPFMNIESEESWCEGCKPINDIIYHTAENDVYMVQIKGATHANFTDISAYKNYLTDNFKDLLGPIDGPLFLKIQSDYILHFFNYYLKDMKSDFLERSDTYKEVRIKSNIINR